VIRAERVVAIGCLACAVVLRAQVAKLQLKGFDLVGVNAGLEDRQPVLVFRSRVVILVVGKGLFGLYCELLAKLCNVQGGLRHLSTLLVVGLFVVIYLGSVGSCC
jgi:hypothetical protein